MNLLVAIIAYFVTTIVAAKVTVIVAVVVAVVAAVFAFFLVLLFLEDPFRLSLGYLEVLACLRLLLRSFCIVSFYLLGANLLVFRNICSIG